MTRLCLIMCVGLFAAARLRAESIESRFLNGLRERHLYRLADVHGTARWNRNDLSDRERAELAIDLALVYTDQALASPPESRGAAWAKADGVCAAFVEGWPANPRRPLVDVQRALVSLARGQQLRDETTGTANAAEGTAKAVEQLRTAVRQLNDVAAAADRELIELRLRPPADRSPDTLSLAELESLEGHVTYQLARAQRQLGLCYPSRSPDRDDALLQAESRLTPLAQRPKPNALVWDSRVELAACQRELGRLQPTLELVEAWSKEDPSADVAARLAAERVRLYLAAGQIQQAIDAGKPAIEKDTSESGELALANLEAALAAWQAGQQAGGQANVGEIVSQVDAIRRRCGPYWARRAQLLVGGALASGGERGDDAQSLLLAAEHLYFNNDIDRALASYARAISLLQQRQQVEPAFAASMTAAAIERKAGRLAEAANRYQKLAVKYSDNPRAAEAHRLAILCLADLLRKSATADQTPIANSYEQLLREHLAHWPQGATADEVRLWHGQWLAGRRDWPAAIAILAQVNAASPFASDAVEITVACYNRQLESLASKTDDNARRRQIERLAAATKQLQPLITGPNNRWPASWSDLQRNTAVALARLHLEHSDEPSEYAERLLAAALKGTPASSRLEHNQGWETAARSLLVAALARNGKPAEARAVVAQLAAGPPDVLLDIVAEITSASERLPPDAADSRRELGQLALEVITMLESRRNELDAASIARLNGYRAAALAASGDRAAALAQYTELAAQSPNDGEVQERWAALLAASNSPDDLRQAFAGWKQVERRSRPGGPRWRRARRARIELLTRLGDQAEADKLLRLTQLLYPDWESAATP
jgi:hypothetical protein